MSLQPNQILLVLFHLRSSSIGHILSHICSVVRFQTHLGASNLEMTSRRRRLPIKIADFSRISCHSFCSGLLLRLLHTVLHGYQMTHLRLLVVVVTGRSLLRGSTIWSPCLIIWILISNLRRQKGGIVLGTLLESAIWDVFSRIINLYLMVLVLRSLVGKSALFFNNLGNPFWGSLNLLLLRISLVEIAFILGRRVIHIHRFGAFLLCNVSGPWELHIERLLQSLDQSWLLLLHIGLVRIANKVDIFAHLSTSAFLSRIERLLFLELVKSAAFFFTPDLRLVLAFLLPQLTPIHIPKERMCLDFVNSIRPEPIISIAHKPLNDVFSFGGEVNFGRNVECFSPLKNLLTRNWRLIWEEWGIADKHFEKNCANGPPIYRFIVASLSKDFWRDVIRRANSRVSQLSTSLIFDSFVVETPIHAIFVPVILRVPI